MEGADAAAMGGMSQAFMGEKRNAVRRQISDERSDGAQVRRDAVDTGKYLVGFPREPHGGRAGPGIGEIDCAVGLDDNVVWKVETAPLEAARDDRHASVEFLARDP